MLDSFSFTTEQLDYAFTNFERSPAAALSFLAADTGVANTPADLGPLIDGVPDVVTEKCVADFMCATDLSLVHPPPLAFTRLQPRWPHSQVTRSRRR